MVTGVLSVKAQGLLCEFSLERLKSLHREMRQKRLKRLHLVFRGWLSSWEKQTA